MAFGLRRVNVLGLSVHLISKISNVCSPDPSPPTSQTDGQTNGQTDGRTTCNLNTALCTSASRGKGEREFFTTTFIAISTLSLLLTCWPNFYVSRRAGVDLVGAL